MGTTVSSPDGSTDHFEDDHDIDNESQDTAESNQDEPTSEIPEAGAPRTSEPGSADLSSATPTTSSSAGAAAATQQLSEESLPRVVAALDSSELAAQLTAAARLRRLLSADDPPIKEAVGRGAVPRLVELLRRDSSPRLQLEAAWALTNIASGAPEHVRAVVDGGALSPLCRLLRASDPAVREQAAWALGNIAGDGAKMRDKVLTAGALAPLVRTLRDAGTAANVQNKDPSESGASAQLLQEGEKVGDIDSGAAGASAGSLPLAALRTCVWALSNLVRGKPAPPLRAVSSALPVLAELTHVDDEEVLTDVCWALSYLGERTEGVDAVIQTGVCSRLAGLLAASSASVQKSALHAVGNIVAGSQVQAQAALDGGALPLLTALLRSGDAEVQRLAAWAISNVTAGSSDQIQAVIDQAAVSPLLALLRSPSRAVRKEAAFALVNVTTSPWPQHTHRLVEQGVIEPLCELLSPSEPTDIVTVTLEGLQNILKIGDQSVPDHVDAKSPSRGNKRSPQALTSTSAMVAAVAAADGKSRMLSLCEQHRSGAIHNISMSLLRTYLGADSRAEVAQSSATASDGHEPKDPTGSPPLPAAGTTSKSRGGRRGSRPLGLPPNSADSGVSSGKTSGTSRQETSSQERQNSGGAASGERTVSCSNESKASGKSKSASRTSKGASAAAPAVEVAAASASQPVRSAPSSALLSGPSSSAASEPVVMASPTTSTTVNGQRVEFMVNIKNFTARRNRGHPAGQYSEVFDGKKAGRWRLLSYTHGTVAGKEGEWLSLYVSSADVDELACKHRWSRTVDYSITLVHPSATGTSTGGGGKKGKGTDEGSVSLSVTRRHTSVVFRGVHNDYEWGCRDFLPSDQVVDQGFLFNDSLLVRVEVELRDDGPGQPLSVLTPPELKAHLAWATENGLPRACLACLTTFACNNGASPEANGIKTSEHEALTAYLSTAAAALVSSTCSEEWGTPLHLACIGWRPGNARVVTLLLDCGAPVDALNKHGETPLVLAAREGGQTSVVAALLDRGGNPCICSKGGWSPMSAAASRGRDDVVRLLAQRGAPLEEVWPPLSALLEAAKAGHWSTAITLLENGADPEVQDEKGNTALWILLEKNMTEAALTMVQRHHASVAQCSRERSKVQRAKLLLKHAQRRNNGGGAKGNSAKGNSLGELSEGLMDDSEPAEESEAVAVNGGGGGDESVALDAEAAALALMSELEEEENNKATKSSKNKKKKDKAKAKKQQQTEQEKARAKEQEKATKEREAARKRQEEERRNKERREFEEKALRDREAAKLQWQKARIEERDRSNQQQLQQQEQERDQHHDGSLSSALSLQQDWSHQEQQQRNLNHRDRAMTQEPEMTTSARSKKRRNSGSEDKGEDVGANCGAKSVLSTTSSAIAKPQSQLSLHEQQQRDPHRVDNHQHQASIQAAPQHQAAPVAKPRKSSSPWEPVAAAAPLVNPTSSIGLNLHASPFPPPAQPSKPASAVGAERTYASSSSSSFTMPLPPGPSKIGAGWSSSSCAPTSSSVGQSDETPPSSDENPPDPLKDAIQSLGQLGVLLSRHLSSALLASAAPVLARRQTDYASFLMMSELELFGLGLEREAVAALLEVQEEEVLSGVGGMGFMDDDDDGSGMGCRGGGMDFLLGEDLGGGGGRSSGDVQSIGPSDEQKSAVRIAAEEGSLPETPAVAVVRHEVIRGMVIQMREIEEKLFSAIQRHHASSERASGTRGSRAKQPDAAAQAHADDDLRGYVFVCSSDTCDEALESCVFGLPGSHLDDLMESVTSSTPIFLFNFSDGTLHGAWVADGRPGMNLSPAAFSSPNRNSSRFPAQLRVKRSEDSVLYPHVTLRLDEENLSFTSKLAGHWSWFGVPGAISKVHTRNIIDKMRERQRSVGSGGAPTVSTVGAATSSGGNGQLSEENLLGKPGRSEGCSVAAALVSDAIFQSASGQRDSAYAQMLLPKDRSEAEVEEIAKSHLLRMIGSRNWSEVSEDDVDSAAAQIAQCCFEALGKIKQFAVEEHELRFLQGHGSDVDDNFTVTSLPSPGTGASADETGIVEVCWSPPPFLQEDERGASSPLPTVLPREYSTFLSIHTFRSLSLAYTAQALPPGLFLPRLFQFVLFHETLACSTTPSSGGFGAFELTLPETFVAAARNICEARPILLSPLQQMLPRHPASFLGTVHHETSWGSEGAFMDLELDSGSFLVHLPACWTQGAEQPLEPHPSSPSAGFMTPIITGFERAESTRSPLSFLVVVSVPIGSASDEEFTLHVDPLLSAHLRRSVVVPKDDHVCECRRLASCASGPPRMAPANSQAWASSVHASNFDTAPSDELNSVTPSHADDGGDLALLFLQNEAGARAWPIADEAIDDLCASLASIASSAAANPPSTAALEAATLEALNMSFCLPLGFSRGGEGSTKAGGISWAKVVKAGK